MDLTESDRKLLEASYIDIEDALAAGIFRAHSLDARELVGRKGGGNFQGLVFPCRFPGEKHIIAYRLRLDFPPFDMHGKQEHKYLTAPGTRNHFYWPLEDPVLIPDVSIDIWITEGEKKGLALHRLARELGTDGRPAFIPLALFGVWCWRGLIGYRSDAAGHRVEVRGVIPDFDRVAWRGRRVFIIFDSNVTTNPKVRAARSGLARELESRGAIVYLVNLLPEPNINGVDDLLGRDGPEPLLNLVKAAGRFDWRADLTRTEKGKILVSFGNACNALRHAPEWGGGVLTYNAFSLAIECHRPPPWSDEDPEKFIARPWSNYDDLRTLEWLEHQGIPVSKSTAIDAISAAAMETAFHPVRRFLDDLVWDGVPRIDRWLTTYCGAVNDEYTRAVGFCWLVSAVARIYEPGCKVDYILILEGAQGIGKSSVFSVLGGEFYSDDVPELGTKDSAIACAGIWIIEFSELAAMGRAEIEKIKSFLSRSDDRYRPPYERRMVTVPRQCVFCGTVNLDKYLKDESGGRRFWPVECGAIHLERLTDDREQLLAESVHWLRQGAKWWLEDAEVIAEATAEQEERYQSDPWESVIKAWLADQARLRGKDVEVTIPDILHHALFKDIAQWTRGDETRVGVILKRLGWTPYRPNKGDGGPRRRAYRPPKAASAADAE